MAGRLEGRVAVITGGASGIGRACALRFAGEGANVVVADLQLDRAEETAHAVRERGREALAVVTDTSREFDCEALADAAFARFDRVDAVVAAAGISHALYVSGQPRAGGARAARDASHLANKPLEHWEKVLSVNLTGVMLTDRAFVRRWIDAGIPGTIVNIASGAATLPMAGSADYCVSKAGVWMLTKVLALEVARYGIRVNAIGPGFIETPMTASARANETVRASMAASVPLGRFGQPEDIANTALFLASDEASYYTGEILFCDGGLFTG
jgi:NAD(P)-dependent dehydrogenase (short-subunit alcohol dehydrogenase family)